jgi:hypothetical protein
VYLQKGVPLKKAEIIPIEPDAGSAVEGILSSFFTKNSEKIINVRVKS